MTLAAEQPKADKSLVWLFELELRYRIETKSWTQDGTYTNCWWMDHATEGEPSQVRQLLRSTSAVSTYTERATLTLCNSNASSWYYDPATGYLYVHTSGSDTPATANKYYLASSFWRRFVTAQYESPDTIVDADGLFIAPRLRIAIPEYTQEVNEFQEVGIRETWSAVNLANGDGLYDADLDKYIWHMCLFYLKVGAPGDAISSFTTICRGRTGSIDWDDNEVEIRTEDQIRAED